MNGNMGLLDTILGGYTSISSTGGTTTLNSTQLAGGTISVTGAMASNITLLFPAVQGWWSIENLTTNNSSFAVLVASGTGATVIGIPPGEVVDIQINGNTPKYRSLARVGSFMDLTFSAIPPWISQSTVPPYLNCDGTTFSAGTYPQLNEFLGGNTLPDSRGRSRATLNQGTGRLQNGVNGNANLSGGGTDTITLTLGTLPTGIVSGGTLSVTAGTNPANVPASTATVTDGTFAVSGGGTHLPTSGSGFANVTSWTGTTSGSLTSTNTSGQAHLNVQPTYVAGLTLIRAA